MDGEKRDRNVEAPVPARARIGLAGVVFLEFRSAAEWLRPMLRCAGASDPGRVRSNNEDAFHIDADRGIFLVVDGIGGQAAGEKAAEIAVERVRARLERQTGTTEQRIREAITHGQQRNSARGRGNPEWEGMACVLTVAVLENGSAVIGHVGDSRLYQIRGGEIRKITHDHSPVGEREDSRRTDARPKPCAIRAATRSSAMSAPRSTRRTTPISSRCERIPFEPTAPCCCAATA